MATSTSWFVSLRRALTGGTALVNAPRPARQPSMSATPNSTLESWTSFGPARAHGLRPMPGFENVPAATQKPMVTLAHAPTRAPTVAPRNPVRAPVAPTLARAPVVVAPAPGPRTPRELARSLYQRMESLFTGGTSPRNPQAVRRMLAAQSITFERQTAASGQSMHVIRDTKTGESIAAARVSPKLAGRKLDRMLERDARLDHRLAAQAVAQRRYTNGFRDFLQVARSGGKSFSNWTDFRFVVGQLGATGAHASRLQTDYTTSKGVSYLGLGAEVVKRTPADTYTHLVVAAGDLGLKLPPRSDGRAWDRHTPVDDETRRVMQSRFVVDDAMTTGMPVLLRDENLVPAGMVAPELQVAAMEKAFTAESRGRLDAARLGRAMAVDDGGRKLAERAEEVAMRDHTNASFANAMLANVAPERKPPAPRLVEQVPQSPSFNFEGGFGAIEEDVPAVVLSPANVLVRYEAGVPSVILRAKGDEPERVLHGVTLAQLPNGRYGAENAMELPDGIVAVQGGKAQRFGHAQAPAPAPKPVPQPAPATPQAQNPYAQPAAPVPPSKPRHIKTREELEEELEHVRPRFGM